MTSKITEENYPVNVVLPEMVSGADWHWAFQLMEDNNVDPINTTGYSCSMVIRDGENGEVYDTYTTADKITMTAASGLFNIDVPDDVVTAYDWTEAEYKIILTDDTGDKIPLFMGSIRRRG